MVEYAPWGSFIRGTEPPRKRPVSMPWRSRQRVCFRASAWVPEVIYAVAVSASASLVMVRPRAKVYQSAGIRGPDWGIEMAWMVSKMKPERWRMRLLGLKLIWAGRD